MTKPERFAVLQELRAAELAVWKQRTMANRRAAKDGRRTR